MLTLLGLLQLFSIKISLVLKLTRLRIEKYFALQPLTCNCTIIISLNEHLVDIQSICHYEFQIYCLSASKKSKILLLAPFDLSESLLVNLPYDNKAQFFLTFFRLRFHIRIPHSLITPQSKPTNLSLTKFFCSVSELKLDIFYLIIETKTEFFP